MKELDVESWGRLETYKWFKSFRNSTYCMNVKMDVTSIVHRAREKKESFFIIMLYAVLKGLNSVDEMRMRIVNGKPVIFDDINPAFTVMTKAGTFENVRHLNYKSFKDFYAVSSENIEKAKQQSKLKIEDYNPENVYNEYYITCVPWVDFTEVKHPIPDDIASQCIPRVCWGKYKETNGKYELTLNITVSHIFVDGFPLSTVFNNIQEYLNRVDEILN